MAVPDDWDQLCKAILAVVESSQGGIPLDVIERDYQDSMGEEIPWGLYGFDSLVEMLSATGTVAVVPKEAAEFAGIDKMNEVRGSYDSSMVVVPVSNPKTVHLQRLVSKQRPSAVTRLGGVVPNAAQWSKEDREREVRQKMRELNMDPALMNRSGTIVPPTTTIHVVDDGPRSSRVPESSVVRQQQQPPPPSRQQQQQQQWQPPVQRQLATSSSQQQRPAPSLDAHRSDQLPSQSVAPPPRRPTSPLIRAAPSTLIQSMTGSDRSLANRRPDERMAPSTSRQMAAMSCSPFFPKKLDMKAGPTFSMQAKNCVPKEFIQKMMAVEQALNGYSVWDGLHTLLFYYARGKDWLLAEHLPLLFQYHFDTPLNLIGFTIFDICPYLQEWVQHWFDPVGAMRVRLYDSACTKLVIWHSMRKKVQKNDMKDIRFAILDMEPEYKEAEEDLLEQLARSIPPVPLTLIAGGLNGPKLDVVTRNKLFWLVLAHFPIEGIALRQLQTAYQTKCGERLKDDQRTLVEQQMADLLRFDKKSPLVTIVRLRFNKFPLDDEVREFIGLTPIELQSLVDEDKACDPIDQSEQPPSVADAQQPSQTSEADELNNLVGKTVRTLKDIPGGITLERLKMLLTSAERGFLRFDIDRIVKEIDPPVERKYINTRCCWVRLAMHSREPWDLSVNRTAAESCEYATTIVKRLIDTEEQPSAQDVPVTVPMRSPVPQAAVVRTRADNPVVRPPANLPTPSPVVFDVSTDLINFDQDADSIIAPPSSSEQAVGQLVNLEMSPPARPRSLLDEELVPEQPSSAPLTASASLGGKCQSKPSFLAPSLSMGKQSRPLTPRTPAGVGDMSNMLLGEGLPAENLQRSYQPTKTPTQRLFERHFNFSECGVRPRSEETIQAAIRAQEGFMNLYGLTRDLGAVRLNELVEISNRYHDKQIQLGDIELRTICIEARNRPDLFNVIYKENEDVVVITPSAARLESGCAEIGGVSR